MIEEGDMIVLKQKGILPSLVSSSIILPFPSSSSNIFAC